MTILELMVVMVIIGILASLLLPGYSAWVAQADETHCMANLRSLYVAGSSYLNSVGSWPQISAQLIADQPSQYAQQWVQTLEPYGAPHPVWICPTMQRTLGLTMDQIDLPANYRIDFIAAPFGPNPAAPRLSGIPWFVEKAASHNRGQLILLNDGSTVAIQDFIGNQ